MSRLTVWNPLRKSEWGIPATWNDVMERFFAPAMFETNGEDKWFPRIDVKETAEAFVVTTDMPGLRPEDINVAVNGDVLTLSGEKKQEEKKEKDQWHITERTYGAFQRSFTFPVGVDPEHVDAEMKDGVLMVKVLKSKKSLPTKVPVRAVK